MHRLWHTSMLSLTLSLCALNAAAQAPTSAQQALRPFYAALTLPLPKAAPSPALNTKEPLTRLAFGSCLNETRPLTLWRQVAAQNPQLFLFLGDNVYGDADAGDATLPELRGAYAKLAADPDFMAFRAQTPFLATWDDHDMAGNDNGASFAFREYAEKIFENFWDSASDVRSRPGIYDSRIIGPEGQRVQIIMLDTRFFRSDLKKQEPLERSSPYLPDADPAKTQLGAAQWAWLEAELKKPAEIRLIVSSIQVLPDAHRFEKWANLPLERDRLFGLLAKTKAKGVVFLSGDRHLSTFYQESIAGVGYPLVEFTSSAMNMGWDAARIAANPNYDEPGANRIKPFFQANNFGTLDIDWQARTLNFATRDEAGDAKLSHTVRFADIGL